MRITNRIARIILGIPALIFGVLVLGTYLYSCQFLATKPPDINDAPWVVQTSSRIYYAKQYDLANGSPTIKGFWTVDSKGKYHFHDDIMSFPKREYGQVAIVRRTE